MDEAVKRFIVDAWGVQGSHFPGPQPISIERKHMHILKQKLYVVCEKTDGVRHLLVCLRIGQTKVCALVDRLFHIRVIRAALPIDTILDGELLDNSFIVHDAILVSGENVMQKYLTERLEKARGVIGPSMGIKISVKRMRPMSDFEQLVVETQGNPKVDGFIFTPIKEPVRTGTHETLFKWKPLEKITIDFLCKENALFIWDRGTGFIKVQNFTAAPHEIGKILECRRDQTGSWQLVKIRDDKDHPNNRRTYLRTLVNMRECIDVKDFLNL